MSTNLSVSRQSPDKNFGGFVGSNAPGADTGDYRISISMPEWSYFPLDENFVVAFSMMVD